MKSTSLFGSVQVYRIILMAIRMKVVAFYIGPSGMGIMGLFNSTLGMIASLTSFSLSTSAVKDIATANGLNEGFEIRRLLIVFRRVVWFTGLLGTLTAIILSPWLSQITFGNDEYTIAFIWISVTLLFNQLSTGQLVILQGLQKLKLLAKANIYGSTIGLIITLPLYYILGTDGIVPGIIGTSIIALFISWLFSRKVKVEPIAVSFDQTNIIAKDMLKMGLAISINAILGAGIAYIIRIYIGNIGSLADVGLFSAGFMLLNSYFGMVLNAIGTDYYPRLSKVANDYSQMNKTVNETAEISLLIISPILIIFMVLIKYVITIFFSIEFLSLKGMLFWATIGMYFKPATWAIGYIFLAKSDSRVYLINEVITKLYELMFNVIAYYYAGLVGLGVSFTLTCILSLIQVYYVSKYRYSFSFQKSFQNIFAFQLALAISCLIVTYFMPQLYVMALGGTIAIISTGYSYVELDKRIDVQGVFMILKNRFTK